MLLAARVNSVTPSSMDDDAEPWIETQEAAFGGWVTCLRRGSREIWFAGGPGIGRIGYELANEDAANAAVALEMGKLMPDRHAELERTLKDGCLGDRSKVVFEDVEDASGITIMSVSLDGDPMGHLVEVNENKNAWFDQRVSSEIEEARELALTLSKTSIPGPSGGPGR